jgi:hypothetical protein
MSKICHGRKSSAESLLYSKYGLCSNPHSHSKHLNQFESTILERGIIRNCRKVETMTVCPTKPFFPVRREISGLNPGNTDAVVVLKPL